MRPSKSGMRPPHGAGPPRFRLPRLGLAVCGAVAVAAACWLWFRGGPELAVLRGHRGPVRALVFSPDGSLLASGGEDRHVRIWDATTYRLRRTLEGHADTVNGLAFAPGGTLLASASADRTVRLWDPDSGGEIAMLDASTRAVNAVAFSP